MSKMALKLFHIFVAKDISSQSILTGSVIHNVQSFSSPIDALNVTCLGDFIPHSVDLMFARQCLFCFPKQVFFFPYTFRVQSLLKMKLWSVATPDTCESASFLYSSNVILLTKRKEKENTSCPEVTVNDFGDNQVNMFSLPKARMEQVSHK